MVVYWGAATVTDSEYTDLMLMLSFELSGATIPDDAYVMAYASFPDARDEGEEEPGRFESVTCTARYTKTAEFSSVYAVNNYFGE